MVGVHINEARVMAVLHSVGPLSVREIAEKTRLSVSTVRRSVQALTRRGLTAAAPAEVPRAWQVTRRGRGWAETRRGRVVLDVPPIQTGVAS
ncbi:MarR family transcriptional regulator [Nocardia farcinica]|uniref:MarR family transcriptional regulator n=1 Tax=Nocardia farcinica TaxID=37329 RepID=UPI003980249D